MKRDLLCVFFCLALAGCKSDVDRAKEAQSDELTAQLNVDHYQRKLDSVVAAEGMKGPHVHSYSDSLQTAKAKYAVTQHK